MRELQLVRFALGTDVGVFATDGLGVADAGFGVGVAAGVLADPVAVTGAAAAAGLSLS
jgi:hypothetical protein